MLGQETALRDSAMVDSVVMPLSGTRSEPNVNDGLWVTNKVFSSKVCVCVCV